ncbi:Nramp family divalent metal transporter [Propionimicrobium sp. PCR01-08-3]|uniref:Nramp family divalent metal transporter n=1 Tax=Propionimicrobium sp. PCR01-08-3 TaxID=3052086 RepID=UPI00255CF15F|nr:Nramp family divalent metal transporter [Propionimicrobium sp. PCR01-08-3]WIY83790.1 Nramp family divalent metal transporter [Propionimicrobium sp. PCR01-08-3]
MGFKRVISLLGPAFVASVAYVDPGNVAANMSAGADYGYLLVWVLVSACLMAMVVQYLSAKLGLVTGRSLSGLVKDSLARHPRARTMQTGFAVQAIVVAIATDVAEVMGGAIAMNLLFGLPGWLGGLIVVVVSLLWLGFMRARGERALDIGVTLVLLIIAVGFLVSLFWAPPDPAGVVGGLVPRFGDAGSVSIAAAMLGATVMPHAIYLHSTLAIDRHRPLGRLDMPLKELLFVQRVDVGASLVIAGTVNVAMLLFGVTILSGVPHTDAVMAAYGVLNAEIGRLPAVIFAIGLLASSVGSAVVGTHAGSSIMYDLLPWKIDSRLRRVATVLPSLILLAAGVNATAALVGSQLILSFGIGFALIPLVWFTGSPRYMGEYTSGKWLKIISILIAVLVLALNVAVIVMTIADI